MKNPCVFLCTAGKEDWMKKTITVYLYWNRNWRGCCVLGIKRFAHRHGHDGLYHETITYAFFFLINERIERNGREGSWDAFAERNRDLVTQGKALLNNYYRAETLDSDLARKVFVMPELQPLRGTGQP